MSENAHIGTENGSRIKDKASAVIGSPIVPHFYTYEV